MASKNRDASAILLWRGRPSEPEVFLVERSKELRFFGGYLALPGGVRGPEDGPDRDGDDTLPLTRCALRELFEETGVLLDQTALDRLDSGAESLRQELLAETPELEGWNGLEASHEGLRRLCRIRTPPFAPVRYDTLFLSAQLPDGQEPQIWPGELSGGRWWRPVDVLEAWRAGEVLIVPPVVLLLQMLAATDLETFHGAAEDQAQRFRDGELHRVQFTPGVILAPLLTPTLPPATTTNCLIVGNRRLFIVDPATYEESEQQRLFDLLDSLRAEGRELEAILSTHHHPDHIGAIAATSARYDLPVHGHPVTLDRLPGTFRRGEELHDGDRLELGEAPDGRPDWQLQVLHTPGHDRGHLCFHEDRYDALVAGDMVSTISSVIIDPPEGHLATYLQSLERLQQLSIGTLYPAHGPAVRDGARILKQYVRHRAQREAGLLKALGEGAGTVEELIPKVYWDTDARLHRLAARSLEAGLEKLAEEGRALTADGGRWRLATGRD